MIKGEQIDNEDKPKKNAVTEKNADVKSKDKDKKNAEVKLTPEQEQRAKLAAKTVLQELLKDERGYKSPRILWYISGCILLVIIGIIASFLIPLLSMVKDAKEVVTQHLFFLQKGDYDKAFELCDKDSFGSEYLTSRLLGASKSIKTKGVTEEFKKFAKELMREKYSEEKSHKFLDALSKDDLHRAVEFCDVEYFAKIAHDEKAYALKVRLDKGPFEVQKFSTVESPPAVRGQFITNSEYFTYNVFNNETWKISNFRLGFPHKKND